MSISPSLNINRIENDKKTWIIRADGARVDDGYRLIRFGYEGVMKVENYRVFDG